MAGGAFRLDTQRGPQWEAVLRLLCVKRNPTVTFLLLSVLYFWMVVFVFVRGQFPEKGGAGGGS